MPDVSSESVQIIPASREWQDGSGEWWVVEFRLTNLRGRVECVGVALRPIVGPGDWRDDLRPLRATTWRQLPFNDVLTRARRDCRDIMHEILRDVRTWSDVDPEREKDFVRLVAEYEPAAKRTSKYDHEFHARVADAYQAAYERGESAPVKFVERQLGLTPDVARKLVARCRKPGCDLLPPTEGRKARGWWEGERDGTSETNGLSHQEGGRPVHQPKEET